MVRGEILPSAWVLQPAIMEGKEITRVIFLAQVTALYPVSRHTLGYFSPAAQNPWLPGHLARVGSQQGESKSEG